MDNSSAALSALQSQQGSAQNPNDILAAQRQQLGVQGAEDTVAGLRGAINNTTKALKAVAPSVMGRTGSSLVTNAQAGKQIQNEQAPIQQSLTDQGTQYNQAGQDLSQLDQKAQQAATGIYQGQQDKLSYAQNLYNTLYQKEQDAANAARQKAAADEQIRQYDTSAAEQAREFNATPHGSSSAGTSNLDLSSLFSGNKATSAPSAPTIQDQAYTSVQKFLSQGPAVAKSDYAATLKSANYGNALDKLKVQLYNQNGIK